MSSHYHMNSGKYRSYNRNSTYPTTYLKRQNGTYAGHGNYGTSKPLVVRGSSLRSGDGQCCCASRVQHHEEQIQFLLQNAQMGSTCSPPKGIPCYPAWYKAEIAQRSITYSDAKEETKSEDADDETGACPSYTEI